MYPYVSRAPADLAAATHMDDEYAWAGVEDPKIVITTSHSPSSRLKQFAKVRYVYRIYPNRGWLRIEASLI